MNRRQFTKTSLTGLAVLYASKFMAACGAAALPFITMGLNLIGTILPTIPGIIAAIGQLTGHQIPAAAAAKLTQIFSGVQDLFVQAEQALNQYQQNNDPTLITKIQDILTQVKLRLSNVLADTQITDAATVTKITGLVTTFVDLANTILNILPTVVAGKVVARKVSHAQMAQVTPQAWAGKFNRAVQAPSGSADVDAAFKNVVAVPKQ